MIPLAVPSIGELERKYVDEAVASGFVSSVGPFVRRFEESFAEAVGARHAVACASGTAAIHAGLIVLGVGSGDVVAVSDFTFVGSVNPVAYVGGSPLLVDSERETWNLDVDAFARELARREDAGEPLPVAVVVVHVLGQPARLHRLLSLCADRGIRVLEDAAESLGAGWSAGELAGRQTGTVGTVGAFSFNGNKILTTGGGGMLVTDDPDLAEHARHLTTQAKVPGSAYLHDEVGYNYRLTNVAAALGLAQLERLPQLLARKREIAARYDAGFEDLPLELPPRVPGLDSTYWLYSVLTPGPDTEVSGALIAHLKERGVESRQLWRPIHAQPPYARAHVVAGAVADDLFARGLSLPCSVDLTDDEQQRVIDSVREFFG